MKFLTQCLFVLVVICSLNHSWAAPLDPLESEPLTLLDVDSDVVQSPESESDNERVTRGLGLGGFGGGLGGKFGGFGGFGGGLHGLGLGHGFGGGFGGLGLGHGFGGGLGGFKGLFNKHFR
ncbi:hypothetical protein ACLKA6_009528 [Drosophila palustris]